MIGFYCREFHRKPRGYAISFLKIYEWRKKLSERNAIACLAQRAEKC